MDLADVGTLHRSFAKEGRHSTAHVYKNALFLSANSAAYLMCRSGKSPVSVYDYTVSIFASVG